MAYAGTYRNEFSVIVIVLCPASSETVLSSTPATKAILQKQYLDEHNFFSNPACIVTLPNLSPQT